MHIHTLQTNTRVLFPEFTFPCAYTRMSCMCAHVLYIHMLTCIYAHTSSCAYTLMTCMYMST